MKSATCPSQIRPHLIKLGLEGIPLGECLTIPREESNSIGVPVLETTLLCRARVARLTNGNLKKKKKRGKKEKKRKKENAGKIKEDSDWIGQSRL